MYSLLKKTTEVKATEAETTEIEAIEANATEAYKTMEDLDSNELEEAQHRSKIAAEKATYDENGLCLQDPDLGNWTQHDASNDEGESSLQAQAPWT